MAFEINVNPDLDTSLSYHWGEDKYEACPSCVRAHELRTCDGETRVSWEICEKHGDAAKDRYFDMAMLNDIRALAHPFYSAIPVFPVITAGITILSKLHLHQSVKIMPLIEHALAKCSYVPWQEREARGRSAWPLRHPSSVEPACRRAVPIAEVTHAHANGCVYGDSPDVIFKSREAVQVMDAYARERLANINALLEAGVSYVLGPGLDAELAGKVERGEWRASPDSAIASPSATDPSSFDDSDSNAQDSAAATERMISNMARSETHALLCAEKKRLEECLATSSLAKGLYFKRCNGAWVSGVGDVLSYGRVWEETEKSREAEEGKTRTTAQAEGFVEDESVLSISTTASTASMTDTGSVFSTPPASSASSMFTTNSAMGSTNDPSPCSSPGSLQTPSHSSTPTQHLNTRAVYGYSHPPYDPATSYNPIPVQARGERRKSNNFVYLTSMLMAREELVRSGQVTPEDLIVTSWGYNRRINQAMKKREKMAEDAKVEVMGRERENEVKGEI